MREKIRHFLIWKKFVRNWPIRIFERLGIIQGEMLYRMKNGLSLSLRGGAAHSDALILWDIYENCPYTRWTDLDPEAPMTILDIGAHVGLFSTWFATHYPKARLYSFEANPQNFALLQKNVSQNRLEERIQIHHQAVTGTVGSVRLYLHEEGTGGHSIYPDHVKQVEKRFVDVPGASLVSLFETKQIASLDLIKLDCEGAEYDILLNTPREILARVRRIAMEYHTVPGRDLDELRRWLENAGFQCQIPTQGHLLYARR